MTQILGEGMHGSQAAAPELPGVPEWVSHGGGMLLTVRWMRGTRWPPGGAMLAWSMGRHEGCRRSPRVACPTTYRCKRTGRHTWEREGTDGGKSGDRPTWGRGSSNFSLQENYGYSSLRCLFFFFFLNEVHVGPLYLFVYDDSNINIWIKKNVLKMPQKEQDWIISVFAWTIKYHQFMKINYMEDYSELPIS